MSTPSPARIYAFDWLRGIAVLVMLETHSLVLLLPEITKTEAYRQLVAIDGLVAQAKTVERVIASLDLGTIELEGSDSLDNPNAVFQ